MNITASNDPSSDPRTQLAPQNPVVDEAVEQLQRHFSTQAEGRCLVLFDPSVRRVDDDVFDGALLRAWPHCEIAVAHPRFPRGHFPYLMSLDLSRYLDSEILRASVRMAQEDRDSKVIGRNQGQRVGGWIAATADMHTVAKHLGHHTAQSLNGVRRPFRFYDMRCLAWLWSLLRPAQKSSLFGPIRYWHILDPLHMPLILQPQTVAPIAAELALDEEQASLICRIGIINRALARYEHNQGCPVQRKQLPIAWDAAGRALGYGLDDVDDMAMLVTHALQRHGLFDTYPTIATLLKQRTPGQMYQAAVGSLEASDIELICAELERRPIQGGV
ncbi:MAG: DUF4123 domain-containing protein [Rhodanobacter sp.]